MLERLKREVPEKNFYSVPAKICIQQKKNRLEAIYNSLLLERYKINLPEEIRSKAKKTLTKMLKISYGK
jgi:quinolinate synthase